MANIAFIGAGNMAGSLIQGLINKGEDPTRILATDIDTGKVAKLASDFGIQSCTETEIASKADVIVLAVKPQGMQSLCEGLGAEIAAAKRQPLFVSIAAGVTLDSLQSWLGNDPAVVRCMPNTPALVGKGASGLFANTRVSAGQRQSAESILSAVGLSVWVDREADLDAVTAVSGSGPAYFFLFMEAMQETAREMGLSDELARSLVLQTAVGAAELAAASEDEVAELRRKVTSPGGTTEQAILTFEEQGLRKLVREALLAAQRRSEELAAKAD